MDDHGYFPWLLISKICAINDLRKIVYNFQCVKELWFVATGGEFLIFVKNSDIISVKSEVSNDAPKWREKTSPIGRGIFLLFRMSWRENFDRIDSTFGIVVLSSIVKNSDSDIGFAFTPHCAFILGFRLAGLPGGIVKWPPCASRSPSTTHIAITLTARPDR